MRRPAALVLLATLVLAGCPTKKPPPDASATTSTTSAVTTATTQPTTTTTLNLSASPTAAQLQDPAYWNAVLAALNRVAGDAFRVVVSTRKIDPSSVEAFREVYGSGVFPNEYDSLVEVTAGKDNGLLIPPGDPVATVKSIVKADSRCVALTASLDYGKVNPTVPTTDVVVKLLPRDNALGAAVNPTPWKIEELFVIEAPDDSARQCTG